MNTSSYQPSPIILERYAQVLVHFALNSGEGVKPGEVVDCVVPDVAKALAQALQKEILKAGAHPMLRLLPTGFEKDFFELANQEQLTFFPKAFSQARVKLIDHQIGVIADVDPYDLKDIDSAKIMAARNAKKAYREWLTKKETQGKFTWTMGLWGVEAKAAVVGLSLEEYWQQIINACYLDKSDPISEWRQLHQLQTKIKNQLNSFSMESLTVKGKNIDLYVKLGADRIWQGGSGRNIPSFEFFTSPDWRGTEGRIFFNEPVYRYGKVMRNITLVFKQGLIIEAHAEEGNELLQEMLKTPNANKIGEYSLTDKRMSRITHTMAETLFDENIGGPFGNTHLAVGMSYQDCFRGDAATLSKKEWATRGFNDSAEHTDIVSTTDRVVTARLTDGSEKIIYAHGEFTLD